MAGILAERELTPTPLEATALALGIHEDTGSLTYPGTTQRDADALAWCLRHGASQELVATYLHTPLVLAANGEKLSKQNGAQPLDLSDPLATLRSAGAVLGIEIDADDPAGWLAQATQAWRARWPTVA